MDFNIYDLFKKNSLEPSNSSNTNSDSIVFLVKNLEQKMQKKFETVDERIKKNLDEIYKVKNDLINFKNTPEKVTEIHNKKEKRLILDDRSKSLNNPSVDIEKVIFIMDNKLNELNLSLTNRINE